MTTASRTSTRPVIAAYQENYATVLTALGESFIRRAIAAEVGPSVHVTESATGQVLFLEFRISRLTESAHICWIRDLTDSQQLQQYRLFTEIGRIRDEKATSVDLAHQLVDAILEFLAVDIAVLTVCERGSFRPIASRGMLLEPGRVLDPEIHSYLRRAVATKQPVLADGSEWEPGEPMELTGVHYIVPLTAAGEIVGTLHLGSIESTRLLHAPDFEGATPSYTFDTLDTGFLEALSGYAGAALANVRLFEENLGERAKLRTLVQALPDGVVVYNSRGEIEIANDAAREISGVAWTNVNTDSRPYRLRTEEGRSISRSEWPFFRAVRGSDAIRNDTVVADFGDRQRYIEVSVIPVLSADRTSCLTVSARSTTIARISRSRARVRSWARGRRRAWRSHRSRDRTHSR